MKILFIVRADRRQSPIGDVGPLRRADIKSAPTHNIFTGYLWKIVVIVNNISVENVINKCYAVKHDTSIRYYSQNFEFDSQDQL